MAMGWCRGAYYQRAYRRGGRVVTEYYGVGFEYLAAEDARERQERRRLAQEARREIAEHWDLLRGENALARVLDDLLARELAALGFGRHDRGRWRRRRTVTVPDRVPDGGAMTPAAREDIADELVATVKATMAGEKGAVERLRALGAAHPRAMITATQAHLETIAAEVLTKKYATPAPLAAFREGILRRYEQVYSELVGENPSAAVRICGRRVAYTELESWIISLEVAAATPATKSLLARQVAVERRLATALKTLEQIRLLESVGTRPIVAAQINVSAPREESTVAR
jgi:hypothetical protein